MRKITLGLANSLDNYIARTDGGADWLHWSKEVAEISAKFLETVDAILIGRKTYEVMLGFGQTSYPGPKNYVFSRSKQKGSGLKKALAKTKGVKNIEIITEDAAKFVRQLKRKKGKGICLFGGGELAKSLFEAHPVLLGSGVPLFHQMKKQIDLELLDSKTLEGGYLVVTYRVKHRKS
jgi:dihydrofolate reductase